MLTGPGSPRPGENGKTISQGRTARWWGSGADNRGWYAGRKEWKKIEKERKRERERAGERDSEGCPWKLEPATHITHTSSRVWKQADWFVPNKVVTSYQQPHWQRAAQALSQGCLGMTRGSQWRDRASWGMDDATEHCLIGVGVDDRRLYGLTLDSGHALYSIFALQL